MLKDTPSLLEREHSRVYRTPSTQFGETFHLVPSVCGILTRIFSTVSNIVSMTMISLTEKIVDLHITSHHLSSLLLLREFTNVGRFPVDPIN